MAAPALDAYRCLASKGAVRLRVSELTSGGALIAGATRGYVTDSIIQIQSTPVVTTGQRFTQPNGSGVNCVDIKDPDQVGSATLAMDLCKLDAQLLAKLTGGTVITSGGIVVGFQDAVNAVPTPVCVEAWSLAVDGSAQASEDGLALYYHFVFPYVTWVQGQQTNAQGVLTVPLTGDARPNDSIGYGPDGDWPAEMTSFRNWYLDDEVPDAECGAVPVAVAGTSV